MRTLFKIGLGLGLGYFLHSRRDQTVESIVQSILDPIFNIHRPV